MQELNHDAWDLHTAHGMWLAVTTNPAINSRGACVMGRGIAKQAALRFPRLPFELAIKISSSGNHVYAFPQYRLYSFPVKHHWASEADIELIARSCLELVSLMPRYRVVALPRPGCGNGRLKWSEVGPVIAPLLAGSDVHIVDFAK